ncbi:MAG: hypothetical protein O9340_00320 [Cyclobacteriaceae bacterium]|nr:hypothetical protein [Cyclobacteriaceae bacterium]
MKVENVEFGKEFSASSERYLNPNFFIHWIDLLIKILTIVAPGPLGSAYSLNAEFDPHMPNQTKDRINAFREHADLFNTEN